MTLPDGRSINLRCSGRGSPTVLLESGWGGGSGGWYKVQPRLARITRVCAYDRAGYGFSDPGLLPRDGAAIARDLDQALTAARVRGPFILVGHSAGGLYVRLFAARRPQEVQGLILLDPTVERRSPQPSGDGLDGIRRRLRRCLHVLEIAPQTPEANADWAGCVSPKADPHSAQALRRPETWRQQLSELDEIFGRTSDQVFRLGDLLRSIPLYVVTASETAAATPSLRLGAPPSVVEYLHQRIAAQSVVGSQTTVLSSHMVMIDRPDVVIDAVDQTLRAVRHDQPPPPLPRSEAAQPESNLFTAPEAELDPFSGASILDPAPY
ncbi:alpha/beta hydrolase [uncultured Phenylobacterium sp.]|uniref:alpha/beta fold hydrolase n=1 Tax=uncultured Phenylobacterium sp. TaxID=349273 RepID=UPI0025DDCAA7|nr:alpha/beta hydrolase [uncultured Phenylobacterium sp.]